MSEPTQTLNAATIVKKVRAAFEHEPRINLHRFPVSVELSDGDLILEGEVEHVAAKKLALELAASIPGIRGIVDRLRVTPAQPMGDGAVRDHVCTAFLQEPVLESCTIRVRNDGRIEMYREALQEPTGVRVIDVSVVNGIVTLEGQVPSLAHKRLAGVLAWWVPGSQDVVNSLDAIPPEDDNDDEISDAVRLVLEKDPFVDASAIHITTKNAVVSLDGEVANEATREMAEFDAWYVFGVDKVVNKLLVRR